LRKRKTRKQGENSAITELSATVAKQQKEITARFKEQDLKIQKASDEVELNKPALRSIVTNR